MKKFLAKTPVRWVLVLPAGLGAYAAVQIIIVVIGMLDIYSSDLWCQFLGSIFCPVAFVWAGSETAPSNRFITAIYLTVLNAVFISIIGTLAVVKMIVGPWKIVWLVVCCSVGIVACVCVCVYRHEQEHSAP